VQQLVQQNKRLEAELTRLRGELDKEREAAGEAALREYFQANRIKELD
jgi:hypothetical protein